VSAPTALDARALELRRAFDRSFAEAAVSIQSESEDLLAIRVAGEPYALRMRELSGLSLCRKLVPLPSRMPHLLGLVAVRGALIPVHELGTALGHVKGGKPARWLAVCGGLEPIALAFEELEAFMRVRRSDVVAAHGQRVGPHAAGLVRREGVTRVLVDVASVCAATRGSAGTSGLEKKEP
jgi:chemotaxis signal transduction protein